MPVYKIIKAVACYVEADTPEQAKRIALPLGALVAAQTFDTAPSQKDKRPRLIDWEFHSDIDFSVVTGEVITTDE
jgi:hypothetical protein